MGIDRRHTDPLFISGEVNDLDQIDDQGLELVYGRSRNRVTLELSDGENAVDFVFEDINEIRSLIDHLENCAELVEEASA